MLQQIALITTFVAALWWRAGWRPTFEFSGETFRQLSGFAVQIAGGRWARLIELLVLSLLIGKLVSLSGLGAWTFAWSTVILPLVVIAIPIAEVLFSAFSRLRGDRDRIAALWLDSVGLQAAVILPLLVGLVVVAPDLIPLVFGEQWHVSVTIIQILSIYVIIRSLQSLNSIVLDAAGRPQVTLWTQLAALALAPLAVIIGAQWSIEAVAVCFVIGQMIAVEIPSFVFVLSELRVPPRKVASHLSGIAAATAIMAVTCLVVRLGLSELGLGMAGRAALTITLGARRLPGSSLVLCSRDQSAGIRSRQTGSRPEGRDPGRVGTSDPTPRLGSAQQGTRSARICIHVDYHVASRVASDCGSRCWRVRLGGGMSRSGYRGRRTTRQSIGFAVAGLLGAFVVAAGAATGAPREELTAPSVSNAATASVGARAPRRSAPRLRQVDGGLGYYGRFSNALPS